MNYLLWAYAVTLVVLGLAAWRLRAGLAGAEADLAALGPDADGPTFGGAERPGGDRSAADRSGADRSAAARSDEDAEHPSST